MVGALSRQALGGLHRRLRDAVLTPAGATRAGLELGKDEAPLHLDWIVAAMAFLAALAIVGAVATADAAARWRNGLTGSLTVEIPAVTSGAANDARVTAEERLKRAFDVLRVEPGIERATPVPPSRIAELLAPWLGNSGLADTLPVPQLIDVTLAPDGRLDMADLKQRLAAAVEGASVDDHQLWIADLVHLARLGVGAALLHLMGAEDGYIADQFAGQATRLGLRGGLLGLLIAALALVAFSLASQAVDPKLLPRLWPSAGQLLPLLLVPPCAAGLGWLTARWTVLQALKKKV
jgi:cell division transport system permease protein